MDELIVRPARAHDREAMLAITRDVWGGTDYVPFMWERWLRDGTGRLMVAVLHGRVVGLQHVALQPDGSAWLEGIRVAEDVRGGGIGEALLDHGVRWCEEMGCSGARLSTASHNPASNRLVEKRGFRHIGTFYPCSARPLERAVEGTPVRVAHPVDAAIIEEFLNGLRTDATPRCFYTEGWTAYRLTEERLRLLLAVNSVLLSGPTRIQGMAIVTSAVTRTAVRLGFLAGSKAAIEALSRRVRMVAAEARLPGIRATVAVDRPGLDALGAAGFDPVQDFDMLLYERRLTQGS